MRNLLISYMQVMVTCNFPRYKAHPAGEMEHEEEVETLLDSNHNAIKKTPVVAGRFY